MKKLLASDIDGTLLLNNKIHDKSIDNIQRFKNEGHLFVLSTGRPLCGINHLFKNYKLDVDAYILCNGAFILDNTLNEIKNFTIDSKIVHDICTYILATNDFTVSISDGYSSYLLKERRLINTRLLLNKTVIKYILSMALGKSNKMKFLNKDKLLEKDYAINIISIYALDNNINNAEDLKNYINDNYSEFVTAYRNQFFVDVVFKNCSKAIGIEEICNKFSIKDNNVYVIGDSWNDLSMFERYANSYTFSYSEEDLKPKANNIVDAFYDCIDHILDDM